MSDMANIDVFSAGDLGQLVRAERKALGLTQAQLAERVDCRRQTIIDLEAGENVSVYTLMNVLAALGKGLRIADAHLDVERLGEIFGDDDDEPQTDRQHAAG
jgi:transcriptional regulator with XRE-family HTH domain